MTTSTQQIAAYYQNLLILQYLQKSKARETIYSTILPILLPGSDQQTISFHGIPASGTFEIDYDGSTAAFSWNTATSIIQANLNSILPSPLTVVVTGTIATGLTFVFSNYITSVINLLVDNNALLDADSNPVVADAQCIGDQLPFQVQNAFNLIGSSIASGVQLDTIGKYQNVTRSGIGFNGPVTLDDSDFLKLIQLATIRNSSGSSLSTIQNLLSIYFSGEIYVFDYQTMQMSYLINTSIIDEDLLSLFISEGLLPRPMAVALSIIAFPIVDKFFAFRTYSAPAWVNTTPFNSYASYDTSWLWLSYQDAIVV